MKELSAILDTARRLRRSGAPFALATVVKVGGSAYRRPGARMLVTPGGETVGTISGGCLEGEVAQHALRVMEQKTPLVQSFDLADDDLILGFGIGCDGTVDVLIEPILPQGSPADPLRFVEMCLEKRRAGLVATVIGAPGRADFLARHLFFTEDGPVRGSLGAEGAEGVEDAVRRDAHEALGKRQPQIRAYETEGGAVEVLFEVVRPPVRLVIFGGGYDVRPVVRVAKEVGWPVVVVGKKGPDVLQERFPPADECVFLMHPEEVLRHVALDARTAAVVMNHEYARDKALIGALLASPVAYVGALGPRRRAERLMNELSAKTPALTDADFGKLHGPVGLDIGTETPEEIALSIIAEIQAVLHGRSGGHLRARAGRIHEAVPAG